jgi:methylated-DNA-protein-cysteine methyltransferase related protein
MASTSDFFGSVFQVVKLIPRGRVTSYGAIATYLGAKKSSRVVGYAMNASHALPGIPAHRVVNRLGCLTGKMHFSNPDEMEQLLKKEGIIVENDCIVNFKQLFWDPSTELEL